MLRALRLFRFPTRTKAPRAALLACALAALCGAATAGAPMVVTYPRPERNDHPYGGKQVEYYPIRLLELALARAGGRYATRPAPFMMTQSRCLLELRQNRHIDVMWTMTSRQREQDLLPVRIPIFKGLIGWRLLLVRRQDAARFAAIRDPAQLKALVALQGHDWPDREIMAAGGYQVQASSDYAGMFKMLAKRRVDYFPRSVVEIWNEAQMGAEDGLVIEPTLALRYPSAFYFFVNKHNTRLAADLRAGLEAMIADGAFDQLFRDYYGDLIKRADFQGRRVFTLDNPLLPERTPTARKRLWYRQ